MEKNYDWISETPIYLGILVTTPQNPIIHEVDAVEYERVLWHSNYIKFNESSSSWGDVKKIILSHSLQDNIEYSFDVSVANKILNGAFIESYTTVALNGEYIKELVKKNIHEIKM